MTVGERIKQKRLELGLSQDELAKRVGYKSRSSINKIELARDLPLSKVAIMSKALNVSPIYLMGWNEPRNDDTYTKEITDKMYELNIIGRQELVKYIDYLLSKDEYKRGGIDAIEEKAIS